MQRGYYLTSLKHPDGLSVLPSPKPRGFKDLLSSALLLLVLLKASASYGLETPAYEVLHAEGDIEYRLYEPFTVVETPMTSDNRGKTNDRDGFMRLFDYISGANVPSADIAMTSPVMQSAQTKIAMTAPVFESAGADSAQGAKMAFMLPSEFDLSSAPVPTDKAVSLRQVPARLVASIRYSGRWTQKNVDKFTRRLEAHLRDASIKHSGDFATAVYNPPFTPPFMRRNEIHVEIELDDERLAALR